MRIALVALLLVSVVGCTQGSPAEINSRTGEALHRSTNTELAAAYGIPVWGQSKKIRSELERRKAFTAQEWEMIDARQVMVGSSRDLVLASRGAPQTVRRSASVYGSSETWIYERSGDRDYIYFQGGQVVGWDD